MFPLLCLSLSACVRAWSYTLLIGPRSHCTTLYISSSNSSASNFHMTNTSSTFTACNYWLLAWGFPTSNYFASLFFFLSIHIYLYVIVPSIWLFPCIYHFFFQWLFSVKSFSLFSHCSTSLALDEVKYSLVRLYTVFVAVSKQGTSCSVMVLDVRIDGNSRWTDSRWQMDSSCCVLAVQCRGTDRLSAATLKTHAAV